MNCEERRKEEGWSMEGDRERGRERDTRAADQIHFGDGMTGWKRRDGKSPGDGHKECKGLGDGRNRLSTNAMAKSHGGSL